MTESSRRAGRPRDAVRDRALLEAALAELEQNGYAGLTTAAVAKRAGVSTATLYRRWSSKDDLLAGTALAWAEELMPETDTGTLAGDLAVLLHDKARTLQGPGGRLLRALMGEAAHNDALAEVLTGAFIVPVQERITTLVRRAVARGEIPPVDDPWLVADLIMGPMVSRAFLTRTTSASVLADRILPYLLRALGAA
ncbi:MAG: TetR/AcrR family transcriptional regulator [Streptosporangiaceae bacterium]